MAICIYEYDRYGRRGDMVCLIYGAHATSGIHNRSETPYRTWGTKRTREPLIQYEQFMNRNHHHDKFDSLGRHEPTPCTRTQTLTLTHTSAHSSRFRTGAVFSLLFSSRIPAVHNRTRLQNINTLALNYAITISLLIIIVSTHIISITFIHTCACPHRNRCGAVL